MTTPKLIEVCPGCGNEHFDRGFGYKLHKCWNCMLAFDEPKIKGE